MQDEVIEVESIHDVVEEGDDTVALPAMANEDFDMDALVNPFKRFDDWYDKDIKDAVTQSTTRVLTKNTIDPASGRCVVQRPSERELSQAIELIHSRLREVFDQRIDHPWCGVHQCTSVLRSLVLHVIGKRGSLIATERPLRESWVSLAGEALYAHVKKSPIFNGSHADCNRYVEGFINVFTGAAKHKEQQSRARKRDREDVHLQQITSLTRAVAALVGSPSRSSVRERSPDPAPDGGNRVVDVALARAPHLPQGKGGKKNPAGGRVHAVRPAPRRGVQ